MANMANINGYPEKCDVCGQKRTCNDAGLCHECWQNEQDAWAEAEAPGLKPSETRL